MKHISDEGEKLDKQPTKVTLAKPTGPRYSPTPNKPIIPHTQFRNNPLIKPNTLNSHSAPPVNSQPIDNSLSSTMGGLSIRETNDSVKSLPNSSPTPQNEKDTYGTKDGYLVSRQYTSFFFPFGGLSATTNVKPKPVMYEAMELVIVVSYDTKTDMTTNIESCELNRRTQLIENYIDVLF